MKCQTHNQELTLFCGEKGCAFKLLCNNCMHPHLTYSLGNLAANLELQEIVNSIGAFKKKFTEVLTQVEATMQAQIKTFEKQKLPSTPQELIEYCELRLKYLQQSKQIVLQRISVLQEAVKTPSVIQTPNIPQPGGAELVSALKPIDNKRQSVLSVGFVGINQVRKNSNIPQQEVQEVDMNFDFLDVYRFKEVDQQDWDWCMTDESIYVCIFKALRKVKLLGFFQPQLFKRKKDYTKKPLSFTYGVFRKRNLIKQPIIGDSVSIKHSTAALVNDCYYIELKKPVRLEENQEYSIALWTSSVMHTHYYSQQADPNPYIEFQGQDLNDNPKIKRNERFQQVISTFRAGLVPILRIGKY